MKSNLSSTEEWLFVREEGFYIIDVPADSRPAEHARLNPGTKEIRRVTTGELLFPPNTKISGMAASPNHET